jgi:uncharacterized protein (DUF1697 family)
MPTNPNMRNEKLRGVFEKLGFSNVQTVISSGNVLFESKSKNVSALETKTENALTARLGIKSAVIIRSKEDLERLVKKDPFKGKSHGQKSYLIITFMKKKPREVANVVDLSRSRTPEFMTKLEKEYGKEITTRTWKTIGRILEKMNKSK